MKRNVHRILLAAGGTGGHMFPAEALARELLARGFEVALVTDARGKGFGDRLPQVKVHRIAAGGVAGKGLGARIKNVLRLAWGALQSFWLQRRLRPSIVVGFGGYPSVPPLLAAQLTGIATVIHEQNAVAGRANRFLMPRARRLALSFERVAHIDAVPESSRVVTGNPVRPEISAVGDLPYDPPLPIGPIHLLVMGGSLGARVFSTLVPEAIRALPEELRRRLVIAQQCRAEDLAAVLDAYRALNLPAELQPFFTDVPERVAKAHLVICRAGASTVAELAAAARPAILVPLPNSIDDHQLANARALEERGGAWVMEERDLTPQKLAQRIAEIFGDTAGIARAAERAGSLARRDAAARLADTVVSLLPVKARSSLQGVTA